MGYELNRFVNNNEINEDLICVICSLVLEDAVWSLRCEHTFCRSCITEWLAVRNTCPNDRQPLLQSDLKSVPRFMRNLLEKLEIRCDFVSDGCNEVIKLEALQQHIAVCDFNPQKQVECERGCGLTIKKADINNHNCVRDLREIVNSLVEQNAKFAQQIDSIRNDDIRKLNNAMIKTQNDMKEVHNRLNGDTNSSQVSMRSNSNPFIKSFDRKSRAVPNPYVLITPLQSSTFSSLSSRSEMSSLDEPSSSSYSNVRHSSDEPVFKKRGGLRLPVTSAHSLSLRSNTSTVEILRPLTPEYSMEMSGCISSPHIVPRYSHVHNAIRSYTPPEQTHTHSHNDNNSIESQQNDNYLHSSFIQLEENPDFEVGSNEVVEDNNFELQTMNFEDDEHNVEEQ